MKKILLLILILMLPIVLALEECPRFAKPKDIPCIVKSTWQPTQCTGNITYYNESGGLVFNASWRDSEPYCEATFNYSIIGTFYGNSTIEDSYITVEGEEEEMILAITIFLLGINILVFALPFLVQRFSESDAGNYVVRKMLWIASLVLLWFNTTLFRQLASDWGLGIDNFLQGYWWMFTFGIFAIVFIMCFVMVKGLMKLMGEAKLKDRMGEYNY